MSNFPRFMLVSNGAVDHRVYDVLERLAPIDTRSEGKSPSSYLMTVVDCNTVAPGETADLAPGIEESFENNSAVMLLDPTAEHKQAIGSITGFWNERASAAYFVAPTSDVHGRRHYQINELMHPVTGPVAPVEEVDVSALRGEQTVTEHDAVDTDGPAVEIDALAGATFSRQLHSTLGQLFMGQAVPVSTGSSAGPPADAPWKAWSYQVSHPFAPRGGATSSGWTPPTGQMVLSGTSDIAIFLDNQHVNGAFFYVRIYTSALMSPHMNQDTNVQRGWAIGGLEYLGQTPAGLSHLSSSPANVNNTTDYTSSTSFTVGVAAGTDGASANFSYTESNSVTRSITDWSITQLSTDQWNFRQQVPFDGENGFSGGWEAAISGGEIAPYPAITSGGLTVETQSVWRTPSILTSTETFPVTWRTYPYYIKMDSTGKSWSGWFWGANNGNWHLDAADSWTIDYSQLKWTGPR